MTVRVDKIGSWPNTVRDTSCHTQMREGNILQLGGGGCYYVASCGAGIFRSRDFLPHSWNCKGDKLVRAL